MGCQRQLTITHHRWKPPFLTFVQLHRISQQISIVHYAPNSPLKIYVCVYFTVIFLIGNHEADYKNFAFIVFNYHNIFLYGLIILFVLFQIVIANYIFNLHACVIAVRLSTNSPNSLSRSLSSLKEDPLETINLSVLV